MNCVFLSYDKFFKPVDWLWNREIRRYIFVVHQERANEIANLKNLSHNKKRMHVILTYYSDNADSASTDKKDK